MKKLLLTLLFMVIATSALAINVEQPVTYVWIAPATGSPVVEYVIQVKIGDADWVEFIGTQAPSYTFIGVFQYDEVHSVKVAGKDAQGRQGGFSIESIPYTPDAGPPGAPTQPILVEIK